MVTSWKANVPSFSRKKSRFSGKKRLKRSRLTCSWSTSTWLKSVFTVMSSVMRGVSPHLASRPPSAWLSASGNACPVVRLPRTYGFTQTLRPFCRSRSPVSVPASENL